MSPNSANTDRPKKLCNFAVKVSPEVFRFFHDIGIRVKEGYGMTECTGLSFIHMGDDIKLGTVGKAIDKNIPFTNFKNLSSLPKVNELIKAEIDIVNQQFARVENIRRFKMLTKELDHDDDEMTATMKIRRANVYKKFAAEIEAIYS